MKPKNNVQFYSHHARELKHTQKHKVRKLLEHNCITYDMATHTFLCQPIPGYNRRQEPFRFYKETLGGRTVFLCPCQWCQKMLKEWHEEQDARGFDPDWLPSCSHCGALYELLCEMNRLRREAKVYVAMNTLQAYQ